MDIRIMSAITNLWGFTLERHLKGRAVSWYTQPQAWKLKSKKKTHGSTFKAFGWHKSE